MVTNATDRITVNVGGRLFETTTMTLESSGSHFFQALLGDTGTALAGTAAAAAPPPAAKRARRSSAKDVEDHSAAPQKTIYIDSDPTLFEHVLYFMRRNTLSAKTKLCYTLLKDLKTEAEFFSFGPLITACDVAVAAIQKTVKETLKSEETSAYVEASIVNSDDAVSIRVEEGKVLYLVSATLAGKCRVKRYGDSHDSEDEEEDESKRIIGGCYLGTSDKEDSGDFQLFASFPGETEYACIAHVGLDHIHVGNKPVNYDFRQDLRLCLSPDENEQVQLSSAGSGDWHVVYWIGDADAIPQLTERPNNKRRKMIASQVLDDDNGDEENVLMALAVGASTLGVASLLGLM